jgi:hypothetical protein
VSDSDFWCKAGRGQGNRSRRRSLRARRAGFLDPKRGRDLRRGHRDRAAWRRLQSRELLEIIKELDYKRFVDKGWEDHIPLVGIPLSLLKDQGIYEGNKFLEFISGLQHKQPRNYYRYTVSKTQNPLPRSSAPL